MSVITEFLGDDGATRANFNSKIQQANAGFDSFGNNILACTTSGTVHALTGLAATAGIVSCIFKADANYVAGNTFTVGGTSYIIVTSGGDALRSGAFLNGDIVSIKLDITNTKLYIRQENPDQVGALSKSLTAINISTDTVLTADQSGSPIGVQGICTITLPLPSTKSMFDFHTNAAFSLITPSGNIYDELRWLAGTSALSIPSGMHFRIFADGANWLIDGGNDAHYACFASPSWSPTNSVPCLVNNLVLPYRTSTIPTGLPDDTFVWRLDVAAP